MRLHALRGVRETFLRLALHQIAQRFPVPSIADYDIRAAILLTSENKDRRSLAFTDAEAFVSYTRNCDRFKSSGPVVHSRVGEWITNAVDDRFSRPETGLDAVRVPERVHVLQDAVD